jgi:hypothetical protein
MAYKIRPGVDMSNINPRLQGLLGRLAEARVVPEFEISSGYRDPGRNARVGGAKGSQHIHGNATDISTRGWTDEQRSAFLAEAVKNGAKGVGIYPNGSFHFDVRDKPAIWGPKGYSGSPIETFPEWARPHLQGLLGGAPAAGAAATAVASQPVAAPGALASAGVAPLPSATGSFGLLGPVSQQPITPTSTPTAAPAAPAENPLDKDWEKGLAGITKALGGGNKQQQQSAPMPGLSNFGGELAARMAPAQALMAQLLASKQVKPKGLI